MDPLLEFFHRRPLTLLHTILIDFYLPHSRPRDFPEDTSDSNGQSFLDFVQKMSDLYSGTLKHWKVRFLPTRSISANKIGAAFANFRCLQDILLPIEIMGGEEGMREYSLIVASHCPTLKFIHVLSEDPSSQLIFSLEIQRNFRITSDATALEISIKEHRCYDKDWISI